jgi:hypothetical protein
MKRMGGLRERGTATIVIESPARAASRSARSMLDRARSPVRQARLRIVVRAGLEDRE